MNEQAEEYTSPPWGTMEQAPVGLGAPGDPAAPAAPIVVSTPAVAPVVVTTKQGVSFSAMLLIAAGAALIGGVVVWMFAGQPDLSTAKESTASASENPIRRRRKARKKVRK